MKLLPKLLLVSVLPFAFIGVAIILLHARIDETILMQQAKEKANADLTLHSERISSFFQEKVSELQLMASTPVVQKGDIKEILPYFDKEQKRLSKFIEGLYYNDAEGMVYDVSGRTFSVRDRDYFPQIARGEVVITNVIESRATHRPIVLILVPVFNEEGNRTGAVGGTILVKDLLQMVLNIGVGESGFAVLMDGNGNIISGALVVRSRLENLFFKALDLPESDEGFGRLTKKMRLSAYGSAKLVFNQSAYEAYFQPIELLNWSLAIVYKEAEIFSQIRQARNKNFFMLCTASVFVGFFIYGVKRILLNPIQTLVKAHQQLARGDLSAQAVVRSKDEIGELAESFNKMVSQLRKRKIELEKDMADRKLTEEKLHESEERFETLIEQAADVILVHDFDGNFRLVNRQACEHWGYAKEELLRMNVAEIDYNVIPCEHKKKFWDRLSPNKPVMFETVQHRKDGSIFQAEVRLGMIVVGDEKLILALSRDITDRKQAEEKTRQHQTELIYASRMSTMGQMASELAHELNQPLATILTQSDIALRKIRAKEMDNDGVGKIIEDIGKQAELAGKIIKRVKDFSQKKEPKHKRTNINDIVKEAMKFVEMEARACNVVPEFDLSENIPSIVADPIQIEQVIINLVLNSLEAMGNTDVKRRRLTLQTLVTPEKDVEIRIHDTGSGMSPEIIKKMFEPFFTTKSEGLGIGLSISRSIIEAHGGRLWAECESDNAGTTFKFTLPSA